MALQLLNQKIKSLHDLHNEIDKDYSLDGKFLN
jgi:hypothetical protein